MWEGALEMRFGVQLDTIQYILTNTLARITVVLLSHIGYNDIICDLHYVRPISSVMDVTLSVKT